MLLTNFEATWEALFEKMDTNKHNELNRDEIESFTTACETLIEKKPIVEPIVGIVREMLLNLDELASTVGPVTKQQFFDAMQFVIGEHDPSRRVGDCDYGDSECSNASEGLAESLADINKD